MQRRHIPVRTCIACRTAGDKRGLMRLVRQQDGTVIYDPGGKANGRGAYLCFSEKCILLARKQKKLERVLKTSVDIALFDQLIEVANKMNMIDQNQSSSE